MLISSYSSYWWWSVWLLCWLCSSYSSSRMAINLHATKICMCLGWVLVACLDTTQYQHLCNVLNEKPQIGWLVYDWEEYKHHCQWWSHHGANMATIWDTHPHTQLGQRCNRHHQRSKVGKNLWGYGWTNPHDMSVVKLLITNGILPGSCRVIYYCWITT